MQRLFHGFCLAGLAIFSLSSASAASDGDQTSAHLRTAESQQHGSAFALSLQHAEARGESADRVIIVVDTSATQTGVYRDLSLATAAAVSSQLSERIPSSLYAADVQCEQLSTADGGAASGLDALRRRTPLGTSNLRSALLSATAQLSGDEAVSLLYVGDGMSATQGLSAEDVRELSSTMTSRGVTLHFAVCGPEVSAELPNLLAQMTGGNVTALNTDKPVAAPRGLLTTAEHISSLSLDGHAVALPDSGLFIRSDRETLLLGAGAPTASEVSAVTQSGRVLSWSGQQLSQAQGRADLAVLSLRARSTAGFSSVVTNTAELDAAADQFRNSMDTAVAAADRLVRSGKPMQAARIVRRAREMDASDVRLTSLVKAIADESVTAADQAGGSASDELPPGDGSVDDALSRVEAEIQVRTERLSRDVNNTIDDAVRFSFDQPDYSMTLLKDVLETVRSSTDISPDARQELERRVVNAMTTVQGQRDRNSLIRQQLAQDEAVREARANLITQTQEEEQRLQTLIDQVRSSLDRARRGDDDSFEEAEASARLALEMRPGNGPATQALVMSESAGQLSKAYNLVNLRHDRFLATLYQVELSHVPFPDEPPVQYPPSNVWRRLTLARQRRYESFDLRTEKPVESWLRRMLDEPVPPLDFPDGTPLSDVLDTIQSYYTITYGAAGGAAGTDYRMTIWPDLAELEFVNVGSLEEVTLSGEINLNGVTLRNALELIFSRTPEDSKLTYLIRNEVMVVTTVEAAESPDNLVTRVYPVADLVIPPVHNQLGGGGGGLGGGGGFGGQGGGGLGGGGGFGGQGGGLGGGGQGGFGQGAFSVPPEWELLLQNDLGSDDLTGAKKK